MDEQALLRQIAALFHENNEILTDMMGEKIENAKHEMLAVVENTVVKRIDALFDGYVSVQERQQLLQTRVDTLAARLEKLELLVKALAS